MKRTDVEVSFLDKGRGDWEERLRSVASLEGAHWFASGYFFPTGRRDLSFSFQSKCAALRFRRKARALRAPGFTCTVENN